MPSSNTYSYTHESTVGHEETSSKRDYCCTRGWPRCEVARWHQATTLEVQGGQATRRSASCYKQQRACENLVFIVVHLGFHCPAWLGFGGKQSRDYPPARATLNAQSMRHGARPGPKLVPWRTRGPLRAPPPRAREKTRGQNGAMCKKKTLSTYTYSTHMGPRASKQPSGKKPRPNFFSEHYVRNLH